MYGSYQNAETGIPLPKASTGTTEDVNASNVQVSYMKKSAILLAIIATSAFAVSMLPHSQQVQQQESHQGIQLDKTHLSEPELKNTRSNDQQTAGPAVEAAADQQKQKQQQQQQQPSVPAVRAAEPNPPSPTSASKPNFIFVLADDLGFESIGRTTHDLENVAPFLTAKSQQGIFMSQYYAMEICTPSRAALMTGKYPLNIGMQFETLQPDYEWGLPLSETLLPQMLKEGGDYKNYAIGKWNLGHFTPELLPTARGFDQFLGFLGGQSFYWSKIMPGYESFHDLTISDTDCFSGYAEDDMETYSTHFYRDKAVSVLKQHNFESNPLFMYLAFQAVHDPFDDLVDAYASGMPSDYVSSDIQGHVQDTIAGAARKQYAMALNVMDAAIEKIFTTLEEVGQQDNTYLIFSSDNGGCFEAGGRNGGLRGVKGSLYEGGTRVDSFIYHSKYKAPGSPLTGKVYNGLFHISDWTPTILGLAGIDVSDKGYNFDGIDQHKSFVDITGTVPTPRTNMLYNMYYKINEHPDFDLKTNAPVAVRNEKYKLIHSYENPSSFYCDPYDVVDEDDDLRSHSCSQNEAMLGDMFNTQLFDIVNDPYETTNLYKDQTEEIVAARMELYALIESLMVNAVADVVPGQNSQIANITWEQHNNYIGPWTEPALPVAGAASFPIRCEVQNTFFIDQSAAAAAASAAASAASTPAAAASLGEPQSPTGKPNFIFVLADDMGFQSIGTETHDLVNISPSLNKMSQAGISLSHFYAAESCTPSRASLLTAKYPVNLGMQYGNLQPEYDWVLPLSETLLPQMLKEGGDYKTYAIGKWNMGHSTPEALPTARGFDQFLGFLGLMSYYWSKIVPTLSDYYDITIADEGCYDSYTEDDADTYATHLYRDKAISVLNQHDFDANPLFMYLALQATHDPFTDHTTHQDGIPDDYVTSDALTNLQEMGGLRKQYAKSLNVMDQAVQEIYDTLEAIGQQDNTFIIFASDNGGCESAGGRNGMLRGVKGTLYEGGTRVDSFIYHKKMESSSLSGKVYDDMFHISDWTPTILGLAGIDVSDKGYNFDGIDQHLALLDTTGTMSAPRTNMLYNMYFNVTAEPDFDIYTNAPVAVRNAQYKLVHGYENPSSSYYAPYVQVDSDDDIAEPVDCSQEESMKGNYYTKKLYDLINDPNEETDLYDSTDPDVISAKNELYALIDSLVSTAVAGSVPSSSSTLAAPAFEANGYYVCPWKEPTTDGTTTSYPSKCVPTTLFTGDASSPTSVSTSRAAAAAASEGSSKK